MPTYPYRCFYPDLAPVDVQAETILIARKKALELFKRVAPREQLKTYNVIAVCLDVTHVPETP